MSEPTGGQIASGQDGLASEHNGQNATLAEAGATRSPEERVADRSLKPRIGDTRPAPGLNGKSDAARTGVTAGDTAPSRPRRRRGGRGRGGAGRSGSPTKAPGAQGVASPTGQRPPRAPARTRSTEDGTGAPEIGDAPSAKAPKRAPSRRRRTSRERKGRPVGRYLMCVHVRPEATQIAVLEGRSLIEHHVAWAKDDANHIDGNIYRGRVKNVLPGMEAAFIDIGTPKNAVLYWGDVAFDRDDAIEREPGAVRIEHLLRPGQTIVCQVTKNPIGLKGARLTEEVSLAGRFVVLVPNSSASGISKRLDDRERKRLRALLDELRPEGHGLIIRTAAEGASPDELKRDVAQLLSKWNEIDDKAHHLPAPALLYAEPNLALRAIREEFTEDYRGVIIDDLELSELVRSYVADIDPALADRVEYYDLAVENLPLFERHHIHEQLHKALDRKVWLASGGSLIIERTEALTVIDVNTGKNVGSSSLEETVFTNNLEAAEEIARQLRLRDIGGIIVIDFIDMEVRQNRQEVATILRGALSRDKTPTQVFDVSELGLVEMTRKRVGEGLVETLSDTCPMCKGRGIIFRDEQD